MAPSKAISSFRETQDGRDKPPHGLRRVTDEECINFSVDQLSKITQGYMFLLVSSRYNIPFEILYKLFIYLFSCQWPDAEIPDQ